MSSSNLDLLADLSASRLRDTTATESVHVEAENGECITHDKVNDLVEQSSAYQNQEHEMVVDEESSIPTKGSMFSVFDEFVKQYPSYPIHTALVFKIYTDLVLKKSLEDLQIEDGANYFNSTNYFFSGRIPSKTSDNGKEGKMRYIFPIESTSSIDLMWLKRVCLKCEEQGAEVLLAIGNVQNIM